MEEEYLIQENREFSRLSDQNIYTQAEWAKIVAYLWNLEDEQYVRQFPFKRNISSSLLRNGESVYRSNCLGFRTRVERTLSLKERLKDEIK